MPITPQLLKESPRENNELESFIYSTATFSPKLFLCSFELLLHKHLVPI